MKPKVILTFLCCIFCTGIFAQNKIYTVKDISETFKKDASAVKRDELIEFNITGIGKAYYKVHQVITVLNENAKDELYFSTYTDKFYSLEDFSLRLIDSLGNTLKKYKKSDLGSQLAGDGLVPDGKRYYLQPPVPAYPITIELNYEIKYNGLLHYPSFIISTPDQSVENAVFVASVDEKLDLRFKPKNTIIQPEIKTADGKKIYKWAVKNLPAIEDEPGSVSIESRYPEILLSPNKFELDGYEGDMTTWQNFGKWYGDLSKNASNLSNESKKYLINLVKDAVSNKEKVKIIYNFLQNNCRYVSIQLGIGGFKPFDANFVDKQKYGDCKALSNYTQACLDAVGIKSYQALINAKYNKEAVSPDFPYNGFNHVIVCVPDEKDSIWLECTSNTGDFGVLGNFTENRNALLITEDGGKLVATPKSAAADNCLGTSTQITLEKDGSGTAWVTIYPTGEYKQDFIYNLSGQNKDDQKTFLVNHIGFKQMDDLNISIDKSNRLTKTTIEMIFQKLPDFTAGNKMFLNSRLYKIVNFILPKTAHRTQDFYFQHPFIKSDTTIYKLPDNFVLENLPKEKKLAVDFGSFTTQFKYDESVKTITSISRLVLDEYKIPAAKYTALKMFFDEVAKENTEKIVVKPL